MTCPAMGAEARHETREARGFKPDDVEEPLDRVLHRPLADRLIVTPLEATPVTPNQLTVASGIASLFAGVALATPRLGGAVAALFLFLSILLDCADGQLARRRGTSSALGRVLDGAVDAIAPSSVLFGMAVMLQRSHDPRLVWPLALATGLSLAWHASVYDALKSIYLAAARPDFDHGGETIARWRRLSQRARARAQEGKRLEAFLLTILAFWVRAQSRRLDPWLDALPRDEAARARFVRAFRPAMRAARWLGFGIHLFVLVLGALLATVSTDALIAAWLIILVPLNAWCVATSHRWTRAERRHRPV